LITVVVVPVRWCCKGHHLLSASPPQQGKRNCKGNGLERIRLSLPLSTDLHSDLDTSVDFFRASLVIDAELENIAVLELERAGFDASVGESHMIEEGARRRRGVLDVKLYLRGQTPVRMGNGEET
jgi:hypothetical protein